MAKSKLDLGGLTDSELESLMSDMKQENARRNKLGNPNSYLLKSRWMVAIFLLAIAFFTLFKAETSSMKDESRDVVTAKTGEKDTWKIEPDHKQVVQDEKEAKKEIDEPVPEPESTVADEPAEETPAEATPQVSESASAPQEETVQEATEAEPVDTTQTEAVAEETTTQPETTPETPAPETPAPAPEPETPLAEDPTTVAEETAEEETSTATAETPKVVPDADPPPADTIYGSFPWKKASDDDKKAAFAQGTRPKVRYLYKRRCRLASGICPLDDPAERQKLAKQWGSWTLTDPKASQRPTNDYAKDFPNRDIPWDKFPANAWQVDRDYLPKFLKESKDLVERALEAILAEHGRSKFDMPGKSFEERVDGSSFWVQYLDLNETTASGGVNRKSFKGDVYGGWVEKKYFDGLVRRLMHSLITEDTFTLVMGGHSASAGHGNHFQQSYTLQFFKVMEPVFARLGIKLHATNNGYGGLGTGQSHLAGGDMYGREIDLLVWDSSMTENYAEAYDVFVRQVFLAGNRIPVLLGGIDLQKLYRDKVTSEIGQFGDGHYGAPLVEDAVQALSIPWAARYLNCSSETHGLCRSMEYNGTCWIERDDYTPEKPQQKEPGGRASWHPGMRQHAVKGRIIAFTVLRALLEGLKQWDEAPEQRLPEGVWHVADHYDNIRTQLAAVSLDPNAPDVAYCGKLQQTVLPFKEFCSHPFNAVGEMTPRANPRETAIRNIMHPAYDGYKPIPKENVYNPPDVHNPTMATPDGEFDYLTVVENGIDYQEFLAFDNSPLPAGMVNAGKVIKVDIDKYKPGLGWGADSNTNPDNCDGSYDTFCTRGKDETCLLYGHNDHRGGLMFDSYSGWGFFTIPNVKLGKIVVRLEWWGSAAENTRTADWEKENNGDPAYDIKRTLSEEEYDDEDPIHTDIYLPHMNTNATKAQPSRRLGHPVSYPDQNDHRMLGGMELCDKFNFQIAVAGHTTSYNKAQFQERLITYQRVVQLIVVPFDAKLLNGDVWDVEVAFRLSGCEKINMFKISHIYWA